MSIGDAPEAIDPFKAFAARVTKMPAPDLTAASDADLREEARKLAVLID